MFSVWIWFNSVFVLKEVDNLEEKLEEEEKEEVIDD